MHYFVSYEKQDRDEGRSLQLHRRRPDKSFSAVQKTRMQNFMGRLDHQLNPSNHYSVRFLWDHQPTINQPLGNPTEATLSQDKDNDWTLVGKYNRVIGATKLYTLRAALVHEKPVRGQQLYQETGDWTLAPPSLVFQNFTDQADINRADFRVMDSYGLDNTFSWFISGARGSHDLKFGSQYTYGEHFEENQRFMNGAFRFFSDLPFNAADPYSYPERLEIRVPDKGEWLSRTHSLGLYVQDKWQMTPAFTLNLGLRYDIHISPLRWESEPAVRRSERVPDRQEQHRASRRVRLQHRQSVGGPRRLGAVLRKAVRRPVQHLPAEPGVHQLVPGVVPGRRTSIAGRARGGSRPIRCS